MKDVPSLRIPIWVVNPKARWLSPDSVNWLGFVLELGLLAFQIWTSAILGLILEVAIQPPAITPDRA
jgi:hypothetical protein